jgi:hypothetical protein
MTCPPALLDVVELRDACGARASGTIGVVVELFAREALVEIVDRAARRDLVPVPFDALRVRPSEPEPPKRRAAG